MNKRNWLLFCLFFLMIFGPKIRGIIDTSSIACLLATLIAILAKSERYLTGHTKRKVSNLLLFFLGLIGYVVLVSLIQGYFESYQYLRFARCAVNVIGFASLVSLYFKAFPMTASSVIIRHLWLCLLGHAILMLLMFLSPSVNEFVNLNLRFLEETNTSQYERIMSALRIGGLTSSWDATSGVNALGLLFLFVFDKNFIQTLAPKPILLLAIPLFLFAMSISGTTGFIVFPILFIIFFPWGYLKLLGRLFIHCAAAFVVILLLTSVVFHFLDRDTRSRIDISTIARTKYMIGNSLGFDVPVYKRTADAFQTIDSISAMYTVLPSDPIDWLIGRGGSGRGRDSGHYYIPSDPGIILNLNNLGIIGFIFLYGFILKEILLAFRYSKTFPIAKVSMLITLLILLIDSKVQYLYARNGFTLMLIPMITLWEEIARHPKIQVYANNK